MTTLFFITYVTYHYWRRPRRTAATAFLRYVYYFVLLTHIPLAALVVPLAHIRPVHRAQLGGEAAPPHRELGYAFMAVRVRVGRVGVYPHLPVLLTIA